MGRWKVKSVTMIQDERGCRVELEHDNGFIVIMPAINRIWMKRCAKEIAISEHAPIFNVKSNGTKVECKL